MFAGNNEMLLNQATVCAALQYYFEKVIFAQGVCPKVESVTIEKGKYDSTDFRVTLSDGKTNS